MNGARPTLNIDIWSDVMCPWCAIGYANFAKSVKSLEDEIEVSVRFMPFELNPGVPPEGRPQLEHMTEVYGTTPEQFEQMWANMRDLGRRAGFAMEYCGPDPDDAPEPRMWNTFEAHKLLRWALADQGAEAQVRLKLALFRAHFQQRRNVGDRQVLLDIAEAEGFDRATAAAALDDEALSMAVRMEQQRGLSANINSVPSFVVEGQYLLPGAREPEAYANALRRIAATTGGDGNG